MPPDALDLAAAVPVAPRAELVQSLSRGLAIMRAFERMQPSLTLSQVARRTGLSRAVVRRFLHTLAHDGYVMTDGKYFRLTPKVLDLGFAYLSSLDIWQVAQPVMQEVVVATGESCSASVLDGTDIVYVARVAAGQIMQVGLSVGSRLPAFCSAMGRVLLGGLDANRLAALFANAELRRFTDRTVTDPHALQAIVAQVRAQGYALVDEELELGLRSLAVPIRRGSGELAAAMNISAHVSRRRVEEMLSCGLPVLQDAARRIARSLPG